PWIVSLTIGSWSSGTFAQTEDQAPPDPTADDDASSTSEDEESPPPDDNGADEHTADEQAEPDDPTSVPPEEEATHENPAPPPPAASSADELLITLPDEPSGPTSGDPISPEKDSIRPIGQVDVIGRHPRDLASVPGSAHVVDQRARSERAPFSGHEALRTVPGG